MEKEEGTIISWLRESDTNLMYSARKKGDGQKAITKYKTIMSNDKYSLMDVHIETGRKNQIRVHFKEANHPIVGDKKYGSKIRAKRLMLCAYNVEFKNNSKYKFEIPYPEEFKKYIKA